MASLSFFSCSVLQYKNYHHRTRQFDIHKPIYPSKSTSNIVTAKATAVVEPFAIRSANYAPTLWTFDHIQSLSSEYTGEDYMARADTLKDAVKMMPVSRVGDPLSSLELIDDLQRLGISYHFQDEIKNLLERIYCGYYKPHDQWGNLDLNLKALGFRLFRQHGFQVPQASYHSFEEESLLDDARGFSATFLKENQDRFDESISSLVSHALEIPLHWRVPRIEAEWFIQVYEKRSDMNPILLELSKLDFNMVQAVHIEDLKHASRWWSNTRWDSKLSFIRDLVVVNFLWTIGFGYLPQYTHGRRTLAKVNSMITTIDDVYDVYGTLDELEQFTRAIERWDINAAKELPDYMKICFLGFHNTVNEIAYNTLADTGFFILPYLKKWADLCKAYLVEARWYYSGYQPTLKEYLDNGWVSISGPLILMNAKFLTSVGTTNEVFQCMEGLEKIVHYSSLTLRLADDLGTATDEMVKGDISKSIQCYMHETGAMEEEARMHIKELILETWKKLNKERAHANSQFSREFTEYATNVARTAQFMYSEGDGHGRPDIIQSHISALLFNPIQSTKSSSMCIFIGGETLFVLLEVSAS